MDCPSGKISFPSKAAAGKASRGFANSGQRHNRRMPVYQCRTCHAWHMTSSSERGGGRLRRKWDGPIKPGVVVGADEAFARLTQINEERKGES